MGIYKVEIFCPRRVRIVSVAENTNAGAAEQSEAADGGSPAASPIKDAPIIDFTSTATKLDVGDNDDASSAAAAKDEEVIVTTKARVDDEGQVRAVDVTYVVAEIDSEDDERARKQQQQQQPSEAKAAAAGGGGVTFAVDVHPPPVSNLSITTTTTTTASSAEERELNIEEELRQLLLEVLPGVRVTWNRCNSLRNMKGDNLESMSVSFLEVAFYAKRRTAMHVAARVMNEIGIGKDFGRVSVFPVEFFRPMLHNQVSREEVDAESRENMMTDISALLKFEELVEGVDNGARLTFDFFAFLFIAAVIAGTGLATNSAVSTVASMLVSPMMGPILATVLGTVLVAKGHDKTSEKNRRKAMRLLLNGFGVEFFCLGFCVALGFVMGFCFWSFRDTFAWGEEGTSEMASRTQVSSLFIGIVVAIPSGAGVALSLLGKNGNSLVGVAISASLLPPAVNCGLYLSFAIMKDSTELARKGAYSLSLTLINVACIYISALFTFYLKHALPQRDSEGRPIDSFFGVEKFDLAARGMLAGKDEAATEVAKERFAAWLSPMPRNRTSSDVPDLARSALSPGAQFAPARATRSASQIYTRRPAFGASSSDDDDDDNDFAAERNVAFVPNRNDTFMVPVVIRSQHGRTRTQPF